ncbi:DUF1329 domain-containing protein [Pseudomarimonas arenosa]|nr:DUF1329 domain-containing protein [Pseudomarimonas arenosa]
MQATQMKSLALIAGLAFGSSAFAAVSADQAKRLGNELTPVGAEKAGNAAGTIPAWTGGITTPPQGYKVGEHHRDPFAADRSSLSITPQNYKQHADKLTEGQKAMFAKYPTFKMNVYPTRRSASFPKRTYEYTIKNATTAKLEANGDGVTDAAEGLPFPIPQNGYEAIWNHKLKYKGVAAARWANQAAPTASGQYNLVRIREELLGLYYKPGNTIKDTNNILVYFYQVVESPARLAGQVLLVHESLNQIKQPRQAWIYNPGQRRVRRAPNVAYDNPGTASDGLRTNDMTDMFNGAMDRFDWELVGKKEMYVPYNSYKAHSDQTKVEDLLKPGHINPDLLRYELHRVWVVEAKLKKGKRHINSRRTFYLDEDSWQILVIDHYDGQGRMWRYSEAPSINFYEVPVFWSTMENHHDLQSGRYIATGLDNQEPMYDFSFQTNPENFSPQALRKRGVR